MPLLRNDLHHISVIQTYSRPKEQHTQKVLQMKRNPKIGRIFEAHSVEIYQINFQRSCVDLHPTPEGFTL